MALDGSCPPGNAEPQLGALPPMRHRLWSAVLPQRCIILRPQPDSLPNNPRHGGGRPLRPRRPHWRGVSSMSSPPSVPGQCPWPPRTDEDGENRRTWRTKRTRLGHEWNGACRAWETGWLCPPGDGRLQAPGNDSATPPGAQGLRIPHNDQGLPGSGRHDRIPAVCVNDGRGRSNFHR